MAEDRREMTDAWGTRIKVLLGKRPRLLAVSMHNERSCAPSPRRNALSRQPPPAGPLRTSGLDLANDHQGADRPSEHSTDPSDPGEPSEFHDIVDLIIARSEEILTWHHAGRASNGRIDGTNSLLQMLRRSPHGLHQIHQLRSLRHPRDTMTPAVFDNRISHVPAQAQTWRQER